MNKAHPLDLPTLIHPDWTIAIIVSQWHYEILEPMVSRAIQTLKDAGIRKKNIAVFPAAGSYEVPLIGAALIDRFDALIGLGIVLQGETHHAEAIVDNAARAMMQLQLHYQKPFAFEILHVQSLDQAKERAAGKHNKGFEAARAVLHSLATLRDIRKDDVLHF